VARPLQDDNDNNSLLELGGPVESTSSGSGGACVVHVVHTVLADQGEQRLGSLLDGLVEGLGRGVAVLSENLVLSEEHSLDTTHELDVSTILGIRLCSSRRNIVRRKQDTHDTTLSVKVREHLLLESGLVEVTGSNGDTESNSLLLGLAGDVLEDGDGGVDTSSLEEESSDSSSGTLWCDEDDIDVLGGDNVGLKVSEGRRRYVAVVAIPLNL
jgi:hypothetical protein